jgi:hypothetical protein
MDLTIQEVKMSSKINTRKFRWLTGATVGALALAAVSVPLTPAQAYIGIDVGGVGIGIGGPGPFYYGPGPYYHHYYGPGYYGW